MMFVLDIIDGSLQSLESLNVTLQLLEPVLVRNVVARSEESFQVCDLLFHLIELVISLHLVNWTGKSLDFIDMRLYLSEEMVRIDPLPDGVVHSLQLFHLLINFVEMMFSLYAVDWSFEFFQIEYLSLQLMKLVPMLHIEYGI